MKRLYNLLTTASKLLSLEKAKMVPLFQISDLYQSVKWLEWLFLNGQASRIFGAFGDFEERYLSARLDWVTMGKL